MRRFPADVYISDLGLGSFWFANAAVHQISDPFAPRTATTRTRHLTPGSAFVARDPDRFDPSPSLLPSQILSCLPCIKTRSQAAFRRSAWAALYCSDLALIHIAPISLCTRHAIPISCRSEHPGDSGETIAFGQLRISNSGEHGALIHACDELNADCLSFFLVYRHGYPFSFALYITPLPAAG